MLNLFIRNFHIYRCIILLFCGTPIFSQREIIIERELEISCDNPEYYLHRCDFSLIVPANRSGKQKVLEYSYPSIKPSHVIKTEDNEYHLKWKNIAVSDLNKNRMKVIMKVRITPYDLKTARDKPVIDPKDMDTLPFLKSEENFRTGARNIKAAASDINGTSRENIVKSIFDYVLGALDYHIYLFQDRGAKQALKDGKGDCTEYSELMVTLCRAKKIPARIVEGLIPHSNGDVGYHNWVEVFFPQYGWVAFDPTWADHPAGQTSFYTMQNAYVQLSCRRFVSQFSFHNCAGQVPFTGRLNDTSQEIYSAITSQFREMKRLYENEQNQKADSVSDILLKAEPFNFHFLRLKGLILARLEKFDEAKAYLDNANSRALNTLQKIQITYAFSNFYALRSDADNALASLKEAIRLGLNNINYIVKDTDFNKIRNTSPFAEYVKQLSEKAKNKN